MDGQKLQRINIFSNKTLKPLSTSFHCVHLASEYNFHVKCKPKVLIHGPMLPDYGFKDEGTLKLDNVDRQVYSYTSAIRQT